MAKDLRHFLNMIERKYPDLLMKVTEQVNPNRFEVSAFLDLVERKNLEKVILFEKALSADETRSSPFVSNIFFSRGICALALDLERGNDRMGLVKEFARREEKPGQIEKYILKLKAVL